MHDVASNVCQPIGIGAIGIRPPAPDREESVKEFVSRNLGSEAFERLIEPFCSGVYAGDPVGGNKCYYAVLRTFPIVHFGVITGILTWLSFHVELPKLALLLVM